MSNLTDILNRPTTNIEPPKPLPPGTYLCIVDGQPEIAKIGKNNTDCVNFSLKVIQAQPDVDQEALANALGTSALSDKKIRHRLFLTDESLWRMKQFLVDHLGLPDATIGQLLPESMGKQVLVNIGHRPNEDGTQVFTEVKSTAKV